MQYEDVIKEINNANSHEKLREAVLKASTAVPNEIQNAVTLLYSCSLEHEQGSNAQTKTHEFSGAIHSIFGGNSTAKSFFLYGSMGPNTN